MRRLVLGVVVAMGVGVWASGDVEVVGLPCLVQATSVAANSAGAVTAFVFTCVDGRVFMRREESQVLPGPEIPGPYADPRSVSCPGLSPSPGFTCVGGGWKPPNWGGR